ncbi:chemotaxis protein CheW [Alteromonadaceae bacterium M269]|nr:chemotaxis protein CheW [Alteromonadaceae bacterium M269]
MTKGSFSNEEVMEDYLSNLLTEKPVDELHQQTVARLLEKVEPESQVQAVNTTKESIEEVAVPETNADTEGSGGSVDVATDSHIQTELFQALYFSVAGLTLAVPLTELGGIHKLEKVSPLFGKPSWFNGVMIHRDEKLNVVDTAKWVMPEKYDEKLAESVNYQYLIMLDESPWGLSCESLVNTVNLHPDDVKWRTNDSKRPWLAGMVKEKMCALVNVKQLISMLNQGLGSNDE